jgi:hypothetical protein
MRGSFTVRLLYRLHIMHSGKEAGDSRLQMSMKFYAIERLEIMRTSLSNLRMGAGTVL